MAVSTDNGSTDDGSAGGGLHMDDRDTDAFVQAVYAAERVVTATAMAVLRRELPDVTGGEFAILRAIDADVPPRVSELSQSLAIAPSTVTRYCDHLETSGFIFRRRDANDRREIRVGLTPSGTTTVRRVAALQREALSERLARLSERNRRELARIVDRFIRAGTSGTDGVGTTLSA